MICSHSYANDETILLNVAHWRQSASADVLLFLPGQRPTYTFSIFLFVNSYLNRYNFHIMKTYVQFHSLLLYALFIFLFFFQVMRSLLLLLTALLSVDGIELTFELPDNAVQCFYEDIKSGVDNILEFQVG